REIDRPRRVRQRADGNVIDTGGGNLADVFQSHTAAGFKFHFIFAQRDRLTDLRGLHVVEQDDVDAVDFQKHADLLERVGLDFDLNTWPGRAEFADCI